MKLVSFKKAAACALGLSLALAPMAAMAEGEAQPAAQPAAKAEPAVKATKAAKTTKAKKSMSSKQVKALQEALIAKGYDLKADGMLGKQTRAALKDFQTKNGLKATGKPNKATRAKLGMS